MRFGYSELRSPKPVDYASKNHFSKDCRFRSKLTLKFGRINIPNAVTSRWKYSTVDGNMLIEKRVYNLVEQSPREMYA